MRRNRPKRPFNGFLALAWLGMGPWLGAIGAAIRGIGLVPVRPFGWVGIFRKTKTQP